LVHFFGKQSIGLEDQMLSTLVNSLMRRTGIMALVSVALSSLAVVTSASAQDLNALIWCDHADPALLKPFEDANGIKVNVKEFEGTGAGLAIVDQSQPGDWDVMVIDSIDIPRGAEKGLFEPLPEDKLPFGDLFAEVTMDSSTKIDGKRYGITEKFGYNTIGFNNTKADPADMQSMNSLFDAKYKGRIAIYDYYLPVIGMAALAIGKKTADLTEADLPAIKEVLLKMKANSKLVGDVAASQTALATGEVDVLVGGGEWVTAGLAKENPALDFSIPKEGAVLWSQSLAMFSASKNKEMALKFIQYIMSPEGQARLATSSCYWGMPANKTAALDEAQKKT
jgi:spermidine/putrescine transport system substrate-binding protein